MNAEDISKLFYTAKEAQNKLGMTKNAFNHYVKTGLIKRTVLFGDHGYYERKMIDAVAVSIMATMLAAQSSTLRFERATLETQEDEFKLAVLNFGEKTNQFNGYRVDLLKRNPDMSYYVYDDKFMVASINITPLSPEGIEKFKDGERGWLLGEYVRRFEPGEPLECIIIDCMTTTLAPGNRRKQYAQRLFSGLAGVLTEQAKRGVEVTNIYACGGTPDGRHILERAKFAYLGEPRTNRHIYGLDVTNSSLPLVLPYKEALAAYRGHSGGV